MAKSKYFNNISVENRKSKFNYEYLEIFTAGIKLTGTEIKSILLGELSIDEAYCLITDKGIVIRNMYIKEYEFGNLQNHEPRQYRTLLLNKSELNSLKRSLINKGLTIIPIKLFRNERGLVKLNVALCRGKKNYDKRQSIKDRDIKKQLNKEIE